MRKELKDKLASFPDNPGIYLMKDSAGEVLYVGKAVSLRNRIRTYFQESSQPHALTVGALRYVFDIDYIVTDNEVEALILESNLIKQYNPRYNVRLKDDKGYPYLKLTVNEPFPGIYMTRQVENDGAKYFGPYTYSQTPREIIKQITKLFPIRTCNLNLESEGNDHRVCLNYHIKQCPGPCNQLIDTEGYAKIVENVKFFLNGEKSILINKLKNKMQETAANLQFEKAAEIRDQLEAIEKSTIGQKVDSPNGDDQDSIGVATEEGKEACIQVLMTRGGKMIDREYYFLNISNNSSLQEIIGAFIKQYYAKASFVPKEILLPVQIEENQTIEEWLSDKRGSKVVLHTPQKGAKLKLVDMANDNAQKYLEQRHKNIVVNADANPAQIELQKILNLPSIPNRIEGFDISNIGDKFAVASMVVFEDGVPAKSEYRKFKIRTVQGQDDFAMMREVITRRYKKLIEAESDIQLIKEHEFPDLVLIDGGKGQLNTAYNVLKELNLDNLPIIGLAKKFEHIFIPNQKEPIIIEKNNIALHLIQQIRDEAHRFALKYHRTLRRKEIDRSILDEIPQVGTKRKQALLKQFGSIENIRNATLDELLAVKGITHQVAENIKRYL